MKVQAYAVRNAGKPLEKFEYDLGPLGPFEVRVQVSHCGICHSDLHLIHNDWGVSQYPLVPGHEIVGTVTECGSLVKSLQPGVRVGIGWQCGSCLECRNCIRGDENLCAHSQATCLGHHGGFGSFVQVDSRFAFSLPQALPSEQAAPLLCGGITVYAPLRIFDVRPWMRVGIVGMGGLGHLAIQYARAFGCEVSVFSHSADKEKAALALGAHQFIHTKGSGLQKNRGSFDFILSTVNASLDWASYVNLLGTDGKLCFVGIPLEPISLEVGSLLASRKSICASPIGGRHLIQEMLEFSARHRILAQVETFPLSEVNHALERVRSNQVRFRAVLGVG